MVASYRLQEIVVGPSSLGMPCVIMIGFYIHMRGLAQAVCASELPSDGRLVASEQNIIMLSTISTY
eukprot:4967638-Lingulodinium_polyedra.AAC.1